MIILGHHIPFVWLRLILSFVLPGLVSIDTYNFLISILILWCSLRNNKGILAVQKTCLKFKKKSLREQKYSCFLFSISSLSFHIRFCFEEGISTTVNLPKLIKSFKTLTQQIQNLLLLSRNFQNWIAKHIFWAENWIFWRHFGNEIW